ncbi:MAG: cyclic pyranopterin monophosphate synthase MoaC [Gemmatimonadaceae bacterium]
MVNVAAKPESERLARAAGSIRMSSAALAAVRQGNLPKGDVLTVARVAGIMAAKRTAELIPLCHPLPLTEVAINIEFDDDLPGLRAECSVRTAARTGVEMEAITGVSVTLITLYDMVKALDRCMLIGDIRVLEKVGGKAGRWARE